ncbi:MAG: hypothetical protein GY711_31645 [bacterium]|nr:hypothetical protein [bacterium]
MSLRPLALVLLPLFTASCRTPEPEMALSLRSRPEGAQVFLSRRGLKDHSENAESFRGPLVEEAVTEEFVLIGTAPLDYVTPLSESETETSDLGTESDVLVKYNECVVRFEKPGFAPVERRVRFHDGVMSVKVELSEVQPQPGDAPAMP